MKSTTNRLLLKINVILLLLMALPCARAAMVAYDITFTGIDSRFGSGTLVFDDTPTAPGEYPFTSVNGSGDPGNWTSARLLYPSAGPDFANLVLGVGPETLNVEQFVGAGLQPIPALEGLFAESATLGLLIWSRVPDTQNSLALLGFSFMTLLSLRKRLVVQP